MCGYLLRPCASSVIFIDTFHSCMKIQIYGKNIRIWLRIFVAPLLCCCTLFDVEIIHSPDIDTPLIYHNITAALHWTLGTSTPLLWQQLALAATTAARWADKVTNHCVTFSLKTYGASFGYGILGWGFQMKCFRNWKMKNWRERI